MRKPIQIICAALAGLAAGYALFDDSSELRALRDREASRSNPAFRRSAASAGAAKTPAGPRPGSSPQLDEIRKRMTADDWRLTEQLLARRETGEYILKHEYPTARRGLEALIERAVAKTASERRYENERAFEELGAGKDAARQLGMHLEKIHKASMQMEGAMQQVTEARRDFKDRLRELLPDEDAVAAYKNREAARPAAREMEGFRRHLADTSGPLLNDASATQLQNLIAEAQAFTEKLAPHGPFDSFPEIAIGEEAVLAKIEREIQTIGERSGELLQKVEQGGLPSEVAASLQSYYQSRIDEKMSTMERIRHPPDDHHLGAAAVPGTPSAR